VASLGFSTYNIMSSVNSDTSITFGTNNLRSVTLKMVRIYNGEKIILSKIGARKTRQLHVKEKCN